MKSSKKQLFYEQFSDNWEKNMNMVETNKRIKVVFDQLLKDVKLKNKKLLEVGHGLGFFSQEADKRGASVTGIDVGKKLATLSKKRVSNGKFIVASADNIPFKDNTFDIVLCTEVIEHMDNPLAALKEIYRVTKVDGLIVITTPNKVFKPLFSLLSAINVRPYHGNEKWFYPWELKDAVEEQKFTVLKEKYFNFIYPNDILDKFEDIPFSKFITINQGYLLQKTPINIHEQTEKEHFNFMAKQYDENYGYLSDFTQYKIDKKINYCKNFINENITKDKIKILDVGCGTGEYTIRLAQQFPKAEIIGIDISEEIIKVAKKKSKKYKNVKYFVDSAYETKLKKNEFDVVCGFYVLHHLHLNKVSSEIKRVLKNGGIGFFYEPNLLNPVVFAIKNNSWLKKRVGDSPEETAINPLTVDKHFDGMDLKILHTEFIMPFPGVSSNLLIKIDKLVDNLRHIPIVKLLSGSLLITMKKK